jgi:biotin transport system substrate-specific component
MLAHNGHLSLGAATAANVWFLIGDSVKVVITALVAKRVHRAYPGLISTARTPVTVSGSPALHKADDREGNQPIG